MLQIEVPSADMWDEENETFISTPATKIHLEHSLVAISKWESIYKRPYLVAQDFTQKEMADYIKCMCLDEDVSDDIFYAILNNHELMSQVNDYLNDSHTATTITENKKTGRHKEKITSELIYYWMIASEIPFSCETWHIERLLMLIRVCNIKNQPPKKQSPYERLAYQSQLNKARRAKHHSKG